MLRCLDELVRCRICLVHGDYSPKNVLIGSSGLWVLDFEVAHIGNPIFDVAFMLHHLVMKAIHLDAISHTLMHCADTFVRSYSGAGGFPIAEDALVRHIGALLLARVHGNSVTTYLTPAEADRVSTLGAAAIRSSRGTITELWPS
jgi:5-methylthioribose kinase